MSDDGLKCFSHLRDSSPRWLSDITKLEQSIEEKQKEMAKIPHDRHHIARNGSVASIREDIISDVVDGPASSPSGTPTNQLLAPRPALLTKRVRSPGSVSSTTASSPSKFRSRSMVIVYYDAEIQNSFEKLVREVGNGRNLIRKAKIAARMEAVSSELNEGHTHGPDDGEPVPFVAPHFRRAGERTPATNAGVRPGKTPTALEVAEKALEKAQSLCERAAHQFLRDGDCKLETQGTKDAFEEVLKISNQELPRLQALANIRSQLPKTSPPRVEVIQSPYERSATDLTLGPIEVDDSEDPSPLSMPELRMIPRRSYKKNTP